MALNKSEKPFLLVQHVWKSILKGIFEPATSNGRRRGAPHSMELASSLKASPFFTDYNPRWFCFAHVMASAYLAPA